MTFSQDNQFAGKSTNPMEKFLSPSNDSIQIKSEKAETYKKEILQLLGDKQGDKAIQDYVIPILYSKNKECIREMLSEPSIEEGVNNYITFLESKLLQMIAYTRSFKNQSKKIDEFKRLYTTGIEIIMPPIINSADVQKSTEETNVPKQVAGDFSKTDEPDRLPIEIKSEMADTYVEEILKRIEKRKAKEVYSNYILPILNSGNETCINALTSNESIKRFVTLFIKYAEWREKEAKKRLSKKESLAMNKFVSAWTNALDNFQQSIMAKTNAINPAPAPIVSAPTKIDLAVARTLVEMGTPVVRNTTTQEVSLSLKRKPPKSKSNTTSKKPKMSH